MVDRHGRQVHRLVLMQDERVVVLGDFRDTVDDDPVLGSVVMALKRQRRTGVNRDPFYLKPVALVNGLVETSGTIDTRVQRGFVAPFGLELVDNGFYVLRPVERQNQHGIHGCDDGQTFDSQNCDQRPVR